jgi:hypothetical protein
MVKMHARWEKAEENEPTKIEGKNTERIDFTSESTAGLHIMEEKKIHHAKILS